MGITEILHGFKLDPKIDADRVSLADIFVIVCCFG